MQDIVNEIKRKTLKQTDHVWGKRKALVMIVVQENIKGKILLGRRYKERCLENRSSHRLARRVVDDKYVWMFGIKNVRNKKIILLYVCSILYYTGENNSIIDISIIAFAVIYTY